jgi:hypothetical protein
VQVFRLDFLFVFLYAYEYEEASMRKLLIKSLICVSTIALLAAGCSRSQNSATVDPGYGMQVATLSSSPVPSSEQPGVRPSPQPTADNGPFVLLQDDFSDPQSGWEIFDKDLGKSSYEMGGYLIEAREKKQTMWGVAGKSYDDIRIDVDARMITAPENGNNAFGVDCRIQENGDGYSFHISSDGWVSIIKFADDVSTELVEWTETTIVLQGNQTNHLTAICQGNHLSFIVNDVQLAEVVDDTFSVGDISFSATTFEDTPTSILFDDVIVLQLGNPYVYEDRANYSLTISNPTSIEACHVYISADEEQTWGDDWMTAGETIAPGGSWTFGEVPFSIIDVKVDACDYRRLVETYGIDLSSPSTVMLKEPVLLKSYAFTQEEDWPLGVVDGGMTSISNSDYYTISALEGDKLVSVFSGFSAGDVVVRSDASLVRPGADSMGIYGITCRMQPDNSGIFFAVRGDGYASIRKIVKGSLVFLTEWAQDENINPGIDSNYIEGDCVGSTFKMYVNGAFIASIEDTDFASGKVGAAVFSPPGATTQADFDFVELIQAQ